MSQPDKTLRFEARDSSNSPDAGVLCIVVQRTIKGSSEPTLKNTLFQLIRCLFPNRKKTIESRLRHKDYKTFPVSQGFQKCA